MGGLHLFAGNRDESRDFALKACLAKSDKMTWELMQRLSGPSISREFLDGRRTGLHNVAHDRNGMPMAQRVDALVARRFRMVPSGKWQGCNEFAFFETEDAAGAAFKTRCFPEDRICPESESWFPASPAGRAAG
ncbi:MAG: hypothetical protein OXH76_05760 [Boseongicola sp.]|nr:hypothetical protein [Boseongicola sp.]